MLVLLALATPAIARSSHRTADPDGPNPVALENARPGTPGWQIPPTAGTVITGYASETSVAPGQSFHLHVDAPAGSRYRVLVYRLGWYHGTGGRLIECVPGCYSSERGTNLMFGSNAGLWRMRYEPGRRTIDERRDPYADPLGDWHRDTGFFSTFGQPDCQLMAVEYQDYTQRSLTAPPTPYTVVGPPTDPWLAAAGLKPGDVIPRVVGYEWDSLIPSCFPGEVVPLMHADLPGSDGKPTTADMVKAIAPSGSITFAMVTMELGSQLDNFGGQTPNPQVVAFVEAALDDLVRPAEPAVVSFRRGGHYLLVSAHLATRDPWIDRVSVMPLRGGAGCANALGTVCKLPLPRRVVRYAAVAVDQWGTSAPLLAALPPRRWATIQRAVTPG